MVVQSIMNDFPFPCTAPIHHWKETVRSNAWFCTECGVMVSPPLPTQKRAKNPPQMQRGTAEKVPVRRQFVSNPNKVKRLQKQLKRQDEKCYYCRQPLEFELAVREHKIPSSRGGPDGWHNLVAACVTCDHEKGNLLESEWTNRWYEQKDIMPREEYLTRIGRKKPDYGPPWSQDATRWNWDAKKRDAT